MNIRMFDRHHYFIFITDLLTGIPGNGLVNVHQAPIRCILF